MSLTYERSVVDFHLSKAQNTWLPSQLKSDKSSSSSPWTGHNLHNVISPFPFGNKSIGFISRMSFAWNELSKCNVMGAYGQQLTIYSLA